MPRRRLFFPHKQPARQLMLLLFGAALFAALPINNGLAA